MKHAIQVAMVVFALAPAVGACDDKKGPGKELDKKVVAIVKEVGALYQGAKSVQVEATLATTVQEGEDKRETNINATFVVERPNHFALRSRHANDANAGLEAVCDGKTLYLHGRRLKQYTETAAPEGLAGIGQKLFRFGSVPTGMLFQNLLTDDPGGALMDGVTACSYAGMEKIGDAMAHHLTFTQPEFQWELWTAADGKPFVLKMSSSRSTDGGKMTTVETYKNWKIDGAVDKGAFEFKAPGDAKKVEDFNSRRSKDG
jgi:hypothetical protein